MEPTEPPSVSPSDTVFKRGFSLHRLLVMLGVAITLWAVLAQGIPRLLIVHPLKPIEPEMTLETVAEPSLASDTTAEPARFEEEPAEEKNPDNDRMQALEARIQALEAQQPETSTLEGRIEALSRQLDATKAELQHQLASTAAQGWRRVATFDAVNRMSRAAEAGDSITQALNQLQQVIGKEAALSLPLEKLLLVGNAPLWNDQQFTNEFASAADYVLFPDAAESDSVWKKITANVKRLVRIRKTGNQPGEQDDAIIARAQLQLQQKGLATAAAELENLSTTAASVFADWLAQARRTLVVREQLMVMDGLLKQQAAQAP